MHMIWAESIDLWTGEYNKLQANILNYDNVLSLSSVSYAVNHGKTRQARYSHPLNSAWQGFDNIRELVREITRKYGGAYRDRTDDLNAASVALSQLS
jgi:hypothetical protein